MSLFNHCDDRARGAGRDGEGAGSSRQRTVQRRRYARRWQGGEGGGHGGDVCLWVARQREQGMDG
jgi:hypothetical protein